MPEAPDVPDDLFLQRLLALRRMVKESNVLIESARDELTSLLSAMIEVQELYPEVMTESQPFRLSFVAGADTLLSDIARIASSGETREALSATRRLGNEFLDALRPYAGSGTWGSEREADRAAFTAALSQHLSRNDQRIAMAEETEAYRESTELINRAKAAATEAEGARDLAKVAAGETGSISLSTFFEEYAKAEGRSASTFRVLTIVSIILAIAAALLLPHPITNDWPEIIYRVLAVVGIAGLGTYFGRQAAQHRLVYNWAKSVQVQLQSFPAFAEIADADARREIFRVFARRVLGALPEGTAAKSADPVIEVAQLAELLAAVARRVP